MKKLVKGTPIVRDIARGLMERVASRKVRNFDSADYWEKRYREGRNSGSGSYNRLAEFKAEIINAFVADHAVRSVIEFGCGDGAQLKLATYSSYTGVDVSKTVLKIANELFKDDSSKNFVHVDELEPSMTAELSMSLDVVYHLVEDDVFETYMTQLFDAAERYVIIYSSNEDRNADSVHVRHRKFTDWIFANRRTFDQIGYVKNRYPVDVRDPDHTSFADFLFL